MLSLIIYDQKKQAEFILKGLRYENLNSELVHADEFFLKQDMLGKYDGVVLLLQSVEMIQEYTAIIRRARSKLPLFVMTSENDSLFQQWKDEGRIDFYYVRPFPLRSIASEMRYAIYAIKECLERSLFTVRDLELDIMTHTVKFRGKNIPLRNKEFALLQFMMSNSGRVLSRSAILESVWDHNSNFLTNTVDVHVSQLRKKIDTQTENKFIHTIPCTGYLFV